MEEAQSLITTEEGAMVLDRLEAEQWERKHLAREAEHYIRCFDAELSTYLDKKKEYLRKTDDTNSRQSRSFAGHSASARTSSSGSGWRPQGPRRSRH